MRAKLGGRLAILLVLAVVSSVAQSSDRAEYAQVLAAAKQSMLRDEFETVVRMLEPWLEKFPRDPELQLGTGIAYYQLRKFELALPRLSAALQLLSEETPAWSQGARFLGMAYYFLQRWKDAAPLLEKVVGQQADDEDLLYALATCYLHSHETEKTRHAYARLFEIKPDSPEAFLLAAHVMYREEYGPDAEKVLLEAERKWPEWSEGVYLLGALSMIKGDYSAAVKHLEKKVAVEPSNFGAWHYLGETYLNMGLPDKAQRALQRAIWLNDESVKSYVLLAEIHMTKREFLVAEDALQQAIHVDPQHYRANLLLAQIYQRTNRTELAKKQMEVANKLRPK